MAYESDGLSLSPRLRRLAQRLAAEEVACTYRHDLTGKLGAARMLVHTLRKKVLAEESPFAEDERTKQAFELTESAVKSALTLVERPLLPAVEAAHDPTDLADLAAEIVGGAGISRLTLVAPSPKWVDADADELTVALVELLDNALDASDSAIEVRCAATAGLAHLDVVDGGPGFTEPAEDAPTLSSTKPGRIGLGLRMVRRVARRWGGSFDLLREGDRTVARIELPLIRGDGSPEGDFG